MTKIRPMTKRDIANIVGPHIGVNPEELLDESKIKDLKYDGPFFATLPKHDSLPKPQRGPLIHVIIPQRLIGEVMHVSPGASVGAVARTVAAKIGVQDDPRFELTLSLEGRRLPPSLIVGDYLNVGSTVTLAAVPKGRAK